MKSGAFDAEFTGIAAHGIADTEFSVTHNLGGENRPRIPRGSLVVRRDRGATLYESGTAWTTTTAYFKSNTSWARFTVMFFA